VLASSLASVPATAFNARPGGYTSGWFGLTNGTFAMMMYFAGSTMMSTCPLLPLPSAEGTLAAVAMTSLTRVMMSWSISCPWVLVTNSFLSSSGVSDHSLIVMNE
jgi:hypothetical protein